MKKKITVYFKVLYTVKVNVNCYSMKAVMYMYIEYLLAANGVGFNLPLWSPVLAENIDI